jgi:hypothetical protein
VDVAAKIHADAKMQRGRLSPAEWFLDARENEPAQWLLFGIKPSRTALYEFLDRLQEFWDEWNAQVLHQAQRLGLPVGDRVALDGTLIAALASRHRLVNQKTLTERLDLLQQALSADAQGQSNESPPGWMAKRPPTRESQLARYRQAQSRMDQLQAENANRRSSKRKKPEKVVVSVSEPQAVPGRDKLKIHIRSISSSTSHRVRIARFNTEAKATSNVNPCSFRPRPASCPSSLPRSDKSTSVQPVKSFSLFHPLSPCRKRPAPYGGFVEE